MGSPHLEEELIGGDCRSISPHPNPSKYARIIGGIGGKGEEARSRGSTMEEREMIKTGLGTLEKCWGRSPFYSKSKYGRLELKKGHLGGKSVSPGYVPGRSVHRPVGAGPTPGYLLEKIPIKNRCTSGPTPGRPAYRPVTPG
jgi:hypothetical protein